MLTHHRADRHQDHRLVAELTWNTFRDHAILEYEIPKYEGDLGKPNLYFPLEEAVARRKIELILRSLRFAGGEAVVSGGDVRGGHAAARHRVQRRHGLRGGLPRHEIGDVAAGRTRRRTSTRQQNRKGDEQP